MKGNAQNMTVAEKYHRTQSGKYAGRIDFILRQGNAEY